MNTDTPSQEIEVTLKINSQAGHDVIVQPLSSALETIKEQAVKFGKWIYVGGKRIKMDLKDIPKALENVKQAIVAAPIKEVRMTGALRGGSNYDAMTVVELRKAAKGKVKGASLLPKVQLITALKKLSATTSAPAAAGVTDAFSTKNVIELRRLAAGANIPGRGTMNRDQLITALRNPDAYAPVVLPMPSDTVKLAIEDARPYQANQDEVLLAAFTFDKKLQRYRFYKGKSLTKPMIEQALSPLVVAAHQ